MQHKIIFSDVLMLFITLKGCCNSELELNLEKVELERNFLCSEIKIFDCSFTLSFFF